MVDEHQIRADLQRDWPDIRLNSKPRTMKDKVTYYCHVCKHQGRTPIRKLLAMGCKVCSASEAL